MRDFDMILTHDNVWFYVTGSPTESSGYYGSAKYVGCDSAEATTHIAGVPACRLWSKSADGQSRQVRDCLQAYSHVSASDARYFIAKERVVRHYRSAEAAQSILRGESPLPRAAIAREFLQVLIQLGADEHDLGVRSSEAGEAERHMADHLLTFYWRGVLSLQSSLLGEFFQHAPEELRQHALEFIGRSLRNGGNAPIPSEVLERLRILWEARLAHAATSNSRKELAAFGWWFISGKFDEEWRCNQLLAALKLSGSVDAEWEVAKALIPFTNSRPLFVLEVLRLLVEADKQGWSIYGWQDEARQILADAFALRRPEVNAAAKEVVDLLVTKGHFQYRQLLNR